MFSLAVETDGFKIIETADWVPFSQPDQSASPTLHHVHGQHRQAGRSEESAAEYRPAIDNRVLKTYRSDTAQFFADPIVQAWLKFKALVSQWRTERGATSSITAMAMCDAYQRIIAMGSEAVPLIIAQMRSEGDEPDQWFWALQVLTDVDPVPPEDRGNFAEMSRAWIRWAENQGYAW